MKFKNLCYLIAVFLISSASFANTVTCLSNENEENKNLCHVKSCEDVSKILCLTYSAMVRADSDNSDDTFIHDDCKELNRLDSMGLGLDVSSEDLTLLHNFFERNDFNGVSKETGESFCTTVPTGGVGTDG